jgi:hypothetical protein
VALKKIIKAPRTQKQKQPRQTRSVVRSVNDKSHGSEPIDIESIRGFGNALNWYNYIYDQDQVRPWIFEYMKRNNYAKDDIAAVRRVAKYKITVTSCSIARIIMNGNVLPEDVVSRFHDTISKYIAEGRTIVEQAEAPVAVKKAAPTIQERTQLKIKSLISDCNDAFDLDNNLNIYEWLKGKEATVQAANAINEYFSAWISDFEFEDEFETREQKKVRLQRLKYWQDFVADCDRYCGNKKAIKVRKPREKKVKSAVDQVSKMQYQKEYPPLKIMSCHPAEMIGASQVWTYNTKYKKLARYDASGRNGIQVKGTTLIGFDIETSSMKSVRKPELTIKTLLGAGKIVLRKVMDEIKTTETKPTGRLNNDTIILRVVK